MTLFRLMNQPLTIQARGGSTTDAYGNTVPGDMGAPVATVGYLEQATTTEYILNRQTTVTNWLAYLPAGTAIHPMDYINYLAQKFEVDGEPWLVFNPRTSAVSHIQCKLTVVT